MDLKEGGTHCTFHLATSIQERAILLPEGVTSLYTKIWAHSGWRSFSRVRNGGNTIGPSSTCTVPNTSRSAGSENWKVRGFSDMPPTQRFSWNELWVPIGRNMLNKPYHWSSEDAPSVYAIGISFRKEQTCNKDYTLVMDISKFRALYVPFSRPMACSADITPDSIATCSSSQLLTCMINSTLLLSPVRQLLRTNSHVQVRILIWPWSGYTATLKIFVLISLNFLYWLEFHSNLSPRGGHSISTAVTSANQIVTVVIPR